MHDPFAPTIALAVMLVLGFAFIATTYRGHFQLSHSILKTTLRLIIALVLPFIRLGQALITLVLRPMKRMDATTMRRRSRD